MTRQTPPVKRYVVSGGKWRVMSANECLNPRMLRIDQLVNTINDDLARKHRRPRRRFWLTIDPCRWALAHALRVLADHLDGRTSVP